MDDPAFEIRRELQKYVRGDQSLAAFAAWFTGAIWNLRGDTSADDLAYEVELRLAELSEGHWTESELKELLAPLVTTHVIRPDVAVRMTTGTSSVLVGDATVTIGFDARFVGTARDTAHA